jgi:hypothetical protein
MTAQEREDLFIEQFKKDCGGLTWEAELLLRHGYSTGAQESAHVAHAAGVDEQRARVLAALGAAPRKVRDLP